MRSHLDEHGAPRIIERRFRVDEESAGTRLDWFLKRKIPRLSRTRIQAIIRETLVRPGGGPTRPSAPVIAGETLIIRQRARPEPPCPRTFGVLYEDDHVLVVDKPAGLPVHASAKFYFNTLTRLLSERYPGQGIQICHRLDRETSGVLVCARGKGPAAILKGAFERRKVTKEYLAIVSGRPPWPQVTAGDSGPAHVIDLAIGLTRDPHARIAIRMVARPDSPPAQTRVQVVSHHGEVTLVRCVPLSGRQHQIRAHLAAVGFPIVGDKLYAHGDDVFAEACDGGLSAELLARIKLPNHALHAASIRFAHPDTGETICVRSPLPSALADHLTATP
ncbi:MAG TPA: RluA family pseudouridine synthase [Kofleriaceae bacterium]|nr:RluA family pseudouridine synthase [Kofleriaceae bacterium]